MLSESEYLIEVSSQLSRELPNLPSILPDYTSSTSFETLNDLDTIISLVNDFLTNDCIRFNYSKSRYTWDCGVLRDQDYLSFEIRIYRYLYRGDVFVIEFKRMCGDRDIFDNFFYKVKSSLSNVLEPIVDNSFDDLPEFPMIDLLALKELFLSELGFIPEDMEKEFNLSSI